MSRCAEGTTYLNIPAKAEQISFHDDIDKAVEARCSPLPKGTNMMRKTLKDLTDLGFDFFKFKITIYYWKSFYQDYRLSVV